MPIYIKVEQRSPEWHLLRAGKPTSSNFDKIVTPGGKLSKQCTGYMHSLLAERMLGHPIVDEYRSDFMQRGQELEDEAIRAYELHAEQETDPGGFVTDNGGAMGCSPDRLVSTDGLLEMKVPAPKTHVGYLLAQSIEDDYRVQVQGQLLISGRQWVDIVSYHPEMALAVLRIQRDDRFIAFLGSALAEFLENLEAAQAFLESKYGKFPPMALQPPAAVEPQPGEAGSLGVSDADVDQMLAAQRAAKEQF